MSSFIPINDKTSNVSAKGKSSEYEPVQVEVGNGVYKWTYEPEAHSMGATPSRNDVAQQLNQPSTSGASLKSPNASASRVTPAISKPPHSRTFISKPPHSRAPASKAPHSRVPTSKAPHSNALAPKDPNAKISLPKAPLQNPVVSNTPVSKANNPGSMENSKSGNSKHGNWNAKNNGSHNWHNSSRHQKFNQAKAGPASPQMQPPKTDDQRPALSQRGGRGKGRGRGNWSNSPHNHQTAAKPTGSENQHAASGHRGRGRGKWGNNRAQKSQPALPAVPSLGFMDLPRELRDQVYELLLVDARGKDWTEAREIDNIFMNSDMKRWRRSDSRPGGHEWNRLGYHANVMKLSNQIRDEFAATYCRLIGEPFLIRILDMAGEVRMAEYGGEAIHLVGAPPKEFIKWMRQCQVAVVCKRDSRHRSLLVNQNHAKLVQQDRVKFWQDYWSIKSVGYLCNLLRPAMALQSADVAVRLQNWPRPDDQILADMAPLLGLPGLQSIRVEQQIGPRQRSNPTVQVRRLHNQRSFGEWLPAEVDIAMVNVRLLGVVRPRWQ